MKGQIEGAIFLVSFKISLYVTAKQEITIKNKKLHLCQVYETIKLV